MVAGVDEKGNKDVFLFGMDKPCYSSLRRLLRVSVYVFRSIKMKVWNKLQEENRRKHQSFHLLITVFRVLVDTGPIIWREIKSASLMWIYTIQHYHFTAVSIAIKQKRRHCLQKQRHCLQKQLGLQLDEFEILQCYGRYTYTDIRDKAKYPKLLPWGSYFTNCQFWKFMDIWFMQKYPILLIS